MAAKNPMQADAWVLFIIQGHGDDESFISIMLLFFFFYIPLIFIQPFDKCSSELNSATLS